MSSMDQAEESTLLEPDSASKSGAVAEEGSSSCDGNVGTEEEDERTEPLERCSDGSDSGLGPDEEGRASNGNHAIQLKTLFKEEIIII